MKRFSALAALVCTLFCSYAPAQQAKAAPPSARKPEPAAFTSSLNANALRAHVAFLASDLLEGRESPSRGLDLAAEYIVSAFRRMGLEPAGGGTFYQAVPIPNRGIDSITKLATPTANNVIGVLRGSDPALKNTYVILSAHYDHKGMLSSGSDRILNGANDDASGVASVLEIANALASLPQRPKRSVLVILFCGEEKGLLGSRYYASHPLVPLDHTVAHINMEQMGRTDSPEGPRVNMLNVTGFDYSTVPSVIAEAGNMEHIDVVKDKQASDAFFVRSDNGPFAEAGIPAHTVSVTYEFPDYHKPGDEWQKLDYDNMARVDRALALGALTLLNDAAAPKWIETNRKTRPFVDAAKSLHPPAR